MNPFLEAPCIWCGYNGPLYWQRDTHSKKCPWHKVGGEADRQAKLGKVIGKKLFGADISKVNRLSKELSGTDGDRTP